MEPIHSLSIPQTSLAPSSNIRSAHTLYHISIKLSNSTTYTVTKRYSEFDALHISLCQQIRGLEKTPSSLEFPPNSLPPKSLFWKANDATLVEERRRGLESYLTSLLYCKDTRWRRTSAWIKFLEIPKELVPKSWDTRENQVFQLITAQAPSTALPTFASWLDEYSKAKELARDAQSCLNERNRHAGSSSGQGIAASQVAGNNGKKLLETLKVYITRLENALESEQPSKSWISNWVDDQNKFYAKGVFTPADGQGNESTKPEPSVQGGQGEIQRRRNLVLNLKKDCDSIEKGLATPTSAPSSAFTADRNALFASSSNSSGASFAPKRKFGVAQETDETRPLEDRQLLQLQTQMMEQQDEALVALSSVLQRQRQIGLAINQELEHQNQMLEDLDDTLTRVEGNLKSGEKKLNRILKR